MIRQALLGLEDFELMTLYEGGWKQSSLDIGWRLAL
jgi:hypothetical protein